MFKRLFSRQNPENVTKSIRITQPMADAIQILADDVGESLNAYIVIVLDQYLQKQVKDGKIKAPILDEKLSS